jgi:UDP-GlcNAc:undecaprenyl-phosphate GlcNAc-1-phosphate transferase
MGHGHRRTVLLLWAWTGLLSGVALVPTVTGSGDAILPFALAGVAVLLLLLLRPQDRVRADGKTDMQSASPHL